MKRKIALDHVLKLIPKDGHDVAFYKIEKNYVIKKIVIFDFPNY